jgi:hypothetical protein
MWASIELKLLADGAVAAHLPGIVEQMAGTIRNLAEPRAGSLQKHRR